MKSLNFLHCYGMKHTNILGNNQLFFPLMKLKSCFPVKDEKEIIFLILKTREKKKNSIVVNK